MADENKPKGAPKQPPNSREARLAAALRENLKRRKQRAPPPATDEDESDR